MFTKEILTESISSTRVCATRFAHVSAVFKVPNYKVLPLTEPIVYTDDNDKKHIVMLSKNKLKASQQRRIIHKISKCMNLDESMQSFIRNELKSFIDYDNYFSCISILSVILNIIPDLNEINCIPYLYYYITKTKQNFGTEDSVM